MGGAFFGSIIFEAIGAFFRWMFSSVVRVIKGSTPVSFKQVWGGKRNTSIKENVEHGFSNIALGVIIVIVTILILKFVGV